MRETDSTLRSVLIVDGDLRFAAALGNLLRRWNYLVDTVDNGERALAAMRGADDGAAPPVALIDVGSGQPGSGIDLVSRLHAEHPDLICVLMSDVLDAATAIAALRRGVYDHFDKSGDAESLFAVLDRCFDQVSYVRQRDAAIDTLRRAKEDAEAASRGKSSFLATMSHELRTPLNAIIGFSEMMVHQVLGSLGNDQYRNYAADIHESGSHLLQIINDILDLSKAEAGKLELDEEVFDLRGTIRSVRQLISSRVRDGGIVEGLDLAPGLPMLRADERKTKQVLLNLVTNAVKFTPPGGQVEITGRFSVETGLTITVRDTGIGISPENIDRVLQPFEQVQSPLSRTHQGTGLGLPLVKAIMELHGGTLQLRSEIGIGTEVSVTFPAALAVFHPDAEAALTAA